MRTMLEPFTAAGLTFALAVVSSGCHRAESSQGPSPSTSSSPEAGGAAASTAGPCPCLAPEVVAPFKNYSADMIRGVAADSDHVYFRTRTDTYRVPLAGGTPEIIAKSPPGMDSPMWVLGDKLLAQPTGQPVFVALPKSGGAWTNLIDATSDRSGGAGALPTIFHSVGRGRIESASQAVFDGNDFFWIEADTVGATFGGAKGKTTWSLRRTPATEAKIQTVYTSDREIRHLVKAGDTLVFQRNETPAKPPLPPGAGRPLFEQQVWPLYSMPLGGGKPVLRAASVSRLNGSSAATDGSWVYYVANDAATIPTLYRLSAAGSGPPEPVESWMAEVLFAAPYGADSFVLFVKGFEHAPSGNAPASGLKPLLFTGRRGEKKATRRVCLASDGNPHGYGMVGDTLLFASQVEDGSGAQGIVKWALPGRGKDSP